MEKKSELETGKETVESVKFKSGLSWRTIFALVYSLFVFTPAVIWLDLNTVGVSLGGSIPLITLLIFTEIAALYGTPLSRQECALILGPATAAGSAGFLNLIYRAYFTRHPLLYVFGLDPSLVPTWWGPSATSPAFFFRTFVSADFVVPIAIIVITHFTGMAGALFFAFIGRELFIEGERLQFPMQQIQAVTIDVLAERPEDRMIIFAWTGFISFIYGLILYTIPTYSSMAGVPLRFLPVPWADYTGYLEYYLPSGTFGIATDLLILASGIVVPRGVVLGIFIGSFARFLLINPLLVKYGISGWATRWTPGMDFTRIFQDSTLFYWLGPMIGIGFAIGLVPLALRGRTFVSSLRSAFRLKSGEYTGERLSGPPLSAIWMVILFVTGCIAPLALDLYLVPDFPVLPLVLYEVVFPFIVLLASGRMIATAGIAYDFPYLQQLTILSGRFLGYAKVEAWFLPLALNPGYGWMASLKVAQLTRTSYSSWIKAALISYPLALVAGYLYTTLFWEIAPIPSDLYPAPGIIWPINIMQQLVWIKTPGEFFDPIAMAYWGAGFGALTALFHFLQVPFSMVGVAAGFGSPIPTATTMLIGMIFGIIVEKIKGKAWLGKYRTTLAAGLGLGEGIAIVLGVVLALALKAMWIGKF